MGGNALPFGIMRCVIGDVVVCDFLAGAERCYFAGGGVDDLPRRADVPGVADGRRQPPADALGEDTFLVGQFGIVGRDYGRVRVAVLGKHERDGLGNAGDGETIRSWLRDRLTGHGHDSGTGFSLGRPTPRGWADRESRLCGFLRRAPRPAAGGCRPRGARRADAGLHGQRAGIVRAMLAKCRPCLVRARSRQTTRGFRAGGSW